MDDHESEGSKILPFPLREEEPDPPRDPGRQIAKQLYLGLRPKMTTPSATVDAVLEALGSHRGQLPREAPPADRDLIKVWSAEDNWEGRYRQSRSIEVLDSPTGDARRYLADLQYQCEVARGVLQGLTEQIEGPPPDDHKPEEEWPSGRILNRWQNAQRSWMDLQRAVEAAREGVARSGVEGVRDDYWEREYSLVLGELQEHYLGGGPQYAILTRRLASLDVRLRQLEQSGRDVSPDEYKSLHDLHLKYTAQLQKHTESLKSESIQPVQDAVKKIVSILERRIKSANPKLWGEVVEDIVQAVNDMGAA